MSATRSGCVKRVEDGKLHARNAHLRQHAPVHELHERVHDALRVDDHLDRGRTASPKRKCASITSSALFASVALSTVILRPIRHVGCCKRVRQRGVLELLARPVAERSAGRREDESAGPRRSAGPRCTGGWRSARCPPGRARRRRARAAAVTSDPAITSDSLFASATRFPRSSAASVASRPAAPTTAFSTIRRRCGSAASIRQASPDPQPGCEPSSPFRTRPDERAARKLRRLLREQPGIGNAVSAATWKRSRCRARTRSAVVPIEPVEPRMATPRVLTGRSGCGEPPEQEQIRDREHEDQAVEPVQDAAVARDDPRAVLHAAFPLEQRFEQVADLRGDADDGTEQKRAGTVMREAEMRRARAPTARTARTPHAGREAAHRPRDGLSRAHGGHELASADRPDRRSTRRCPRPR